MATEKTKLLYNVPNGHRKDQMAIKYTNVFHCKTLQNLPKSLEKDYSLKVAPPKRLDDQKVCYQFTSRKLSEGVVFLRAVLAGRVGDAGGSGRAAPQVCGTAQRQAGPRAGSMDR
jgi:hypothetical protein